MIFVSSKKSEKYTKSQKKTAADIDQNGFTSIFKKNSSPIIRLLKKS